MARKIIKKENYSIIIDDGKESTIYQKVIEVRPNSVKVISKIGNEYFVKLSDKVKAISINEMDTVEIKINGKDWLVTDVIPYKKETIEDDEEELEIQLQMFDNLTGGY